MGSNASNSKLAIAIIIISKECCIYVFQDHKQLSFRNGLWSSAFTLNGIQRSTWPLFLYTVGEEITKVHRNQARLPNTSPRPDLQQQIYIMYIYEWSL